MKIYVARGKKDVPGNFRKLIAFLKNVGGFEVYLIGDTGYDWELAHRFQLDGLAKAPKEIEHTLEEKDSKH